MTIDELLVDFDEMGFAPTTLCENPDEYACKWKRQLLTEIDRLKIQLEQANAGIVNCSGCKLVEINVVREFAEKLKQAICDNTYPYFDKNGKPVNIWNTDGFDRIDELLKEYEK